jgi:ABC-type uncharacterized transport system substrate-binding protein
MKWKTLCVGLAVCWIFGHQAVCWSHPHVFIHAAVDAVFDDEGLAGFRVRWVFDEMFSSTIRMDYDRNDNRRFEPSEVKALEEGAFSNLKKFNYFVHVDIQGKPFEVRSVRDFTAELKGEKMLYRFFVPCPVRATPRFKEIHIAVYDPEFYCSIFLIEDPLAYENREPYEVSCRVEDDPDRAYYFGQIIPQEIRMRFKQKS